MLNDMPDGTTSPTTDFEHPIRSSFCIIGTSADSDDEVPRTVSTSSFMYRMNRHRLNPVHAAMLPRTPATKIKHVR